MGILLELTISLPGKKCFVQFSNSQNPSGLIQSVLILIISRQIIRIKFSMKKKIHEKLELENGS